MSASAAPRSTPRSSGHSVATTSADAPRTASSAEGQSVRRVASSGGSAPTAGSNARTRAPRAARARQVSTAADRWRVSVPGL
jgi:hypothetical protein